MKTSAEEIENRITEIDPEVEFLAVENAGGDALRIYIDYPGGVNLAICQKVTSGLGELLEKHTLEVSSPGPHRPLTKPEHFVRFEGRRAKGQDDRGDRRTQKLHRDDPRSSRE